MAALIQNQATNYTLYYNVLEYFKTIMTNHPSISRVSQGDIQTIDTDEFSQYPIGNVMITDANLGINTTDFTVQLIIMDKQKLRNNDSTGPTNQQTIPFFGVDDMVDIHANTLAILNDLTAYTQRSVQSFSIDENILCTPFADRFNNGLAGWSATFTLTTHNDKNRCLFDLITTTTTTTAAPTTTTTTTAAP
jgi:hypothetical protein